MINIAELKGNKIKTAISAESVNKRYHNKNKSGGNFGFTIIKDKTWYDLSGYYNTKGEVHGLRFGHFSCSGAEVAVTTATFNELTSSLNKMVQAMEDYEVMNKQDD